MLALMVLGLIPRLLHLDGTVFGDELSTLYIVKDQSLSHVISTVASDAEISPPLYFVLAWIGSQLGSSPELIRIPALIAGTAMIPLTYLVGARAIGRLAGLIAALVITLNPFMIFYATDGRGYTVAIALLLGSTLAMLKAVDTGRRGWWAAYGALSCLAMYTHYTAGFVLLAQLGWLLWADPRARVAALLANVAAAIAFLPWLPSMRADFDSPTVELLSGLQGDGFTIKRVAVESWAFGYPYNLPERVPGRAALVVAAIGLLVASGAAVRGWISSRSDGEAPARLRLSKGVILVFALALATPVAEATILLLGGSDLFGARNLNTASGGFALSLGAVLWAAGPALGTACAVALIGVFTLGAAKSLETEVSTIGFKAAAQYIDAEAGPDDVVVDLLSPGVSPVPLTALDAHLPQTRREYIGYLPPGPPPFLIDAGPPKPLVEEAFEVAGPNRVFLVVGEGTVHSGPGGTDPVIDLPFAVHVTPLEGPLTRFRPPPGSRLVAERSYPGLGPVDVAVIQPGPG